MGAWIISFLLYVGRRQGRALRPVVLYIGGTSPAGSNNFDDGRGFVVSTTLGAADPISS